MDQPGKVANPARGQLNREKYTLTLISMQGHQNHNPFYLRVLDYSLREIKVVNITK